MPLPIGMEEVSLGAQTKDTCMNLDTVLWTNQKNYTVYGNNCISAEVIFHKSRVR